MERWEIELRASLDGAVRDNIALRAELEAVKAKCAEYQEAAHDRTAAWTAAESELARLKDRVALDGLMPPIRQVLADFAHDNRNASIWELEDKIQSSLEAPAVGQRVEKYTGEARWSGILVAAYQTTKGKQRYVVEVEPQGFQMIAVPGQLRAVGDTAREGQDDA